MALCACPSQRIVKRQAHARHEIVDLPLVNDHCRAEAHHIAEAARQDAAGGRELAGLVCHLPGGGEILSGRLVLDEFEASNETDAAGFADQRMLAELPSAILKDGATERTCPTISISS